jgi:SAM-dependent methyltransferase
MCLEPIPPDEAGPSSNRSLRVAYPWLRHRHEGDLYLPPEAYHRLLKPYIFDGISDLGHFRQFLGEVTIPGNQVILELGPGTGRATDVLLERLRPRRLDLLDQSPRMISFLRNKYSDLSFLRFIESDVVDYFQRPHVAYDLIFSMWSLSHAIHQNFMQYGTKKGRDLTLNALANMFQGSLSVGGLFYLMHFDPLSDEQRMIIRQRQKVFPFLAAPGQSPSKQLIDEVLEGLRRDGVMTWSCKHYAGSPIIYNNLDEALETIMNFHMEAVLNWSGQVRDVLSELTGDLRTHMCQDGTISVRPGCFIYKARRVG